MSTQLHGEKNQKKSKRQSISSRAGIIFSVSRTLRKLKEGRYSKRCGKGCAIYMAAVLQYLSSELLELCGEMAKTSKRRSVVPRHIQIAVRKDKEFNELFKNVTIAHGGVLPNIHNFLLRKSKKKRSQNKN